MPNVEEQLHGPDQVDVAVLATGPGAGIFIDATIVRCLMVPALIALFGRYNWWLPPWLARLLFVAPTPLPAASRDAGRHHAGRRPILLVDQARRQRPAQVKYGYIT